MEIMRVYRGIELSRSFARYLFSRNSTSLFATLFWSIALILSIYMTAEPVLRWLLSIPYLLFSPGYSFLALLIREDELAAVERFALSLGLSLCLVALVGVVLSLTPLGITANSMTASLLAFNLTALLASTYLRYLREEDQ